MPDSFSVANNSVEDAVAEVVDAFRDSVRRGERPDVEEYALRYPHLADILRRVLPALEVLRPPEGSSPSLSAVEDMPAVLGDFRILREVGKGGMGIVYEAEQLSLRRRVALKVLPFAATMDPRHLQRFHNEAQAAACLHHPNIVPVYFVGCERSVHFYAMQFIEGQSLAELIAVQKHELASGACQRPGESNRVVNTPRSPGAATLPIAAASTQAIPRDAAHYRRIAEWSIQAAEALEHAHSLGIVHRDIKPSNLMIDGAGKLWITDFGLARTATDAGLTMTGDVVGTLRYMSPEQALAKHGLVDHRSDIYSLGATLYELLTLRPVVDGKDREEILGKITFEEPASPRSLDRAIPADLETIVLKALAKEPAERYATAQQLADDSRRLLEDRPIRAKRPTLLQRLRKWTQRHRRLIWITAFFLLLMVIALTVSIVLIWQEKEQTKTALGEARAHAIEAETQRWRVMASAQEAYWMLENLLCAFDPERSVRPLSVLELREWQTGEVLHFLASFREDQSEEPVARLQKGAAFVHTGRVYQVLRNWERAEREFHEAVRVYDHLIEDFPDDSRFANARSRALCILAENAYEEGRLSIANAYCRQAVGAWRDVLRIHPKNCEAYVRLAFLLCNWFDTHLRDPTAAVEVARRAVELAPENPEAWLALGTALYRTGQWDASLVVLQKTLQWPEVRHKWAWTHSLLLLAMAQRRCERREEAIRAYRQAEQRMAISFRARDVMDRAILAEAAALLGIKQLAALKAKEESPEKD